MKARLYLLILLIIYFCHASTAIGADEQVKAMDSSGHVCDLKPENPMLAPLAVSGNAAHQESDHAPGQTTEQTTEQTTKSAPLRGHLTHESIGVLRSLPPGREPDYVIGHFAMGITPFFKIAVNGPIGDTAHLAAKFVKKWQGRQVHPCILKLAALEDGSKGYYFNTITSTDGPRGWLMPMPRRPGQDKVIPWAIYFDQ